jgi:hypothetical protein
MFKKYGKVNDKDIIYSLNRIGEIANSRLNALVFYLDADMKVLKNCKNRFQGNDIDIEYLEGKFAVSITGMTGYFDTIVEATEKAVEIYKSNTYEQV